MTQSNNCILCTSDGGVLIAKTKHWRLIRATDQKGFPLTYRVIWNAHVAEFSDLNASEREQCMTVVAWVEQAMRAHLAPDKINLAALGNVVPHLHWHIIARYQWDSHFPAPVWAPAVRETPASLWDELKEQQNRLEDFLKNNADTYA